MKTVVQSVQHETQQHTSLLLAVIADMQAMSCTLQQTTRQAALVPSLPSATQIHGAPISQPRAQSSSVPIVDCPTAVATVTPGFKSLRAMEIAPGVHHWPPPTHDHAVRSLCQHGLTEQFHQPFTLDLREDFDRYPGDQAWRCLQSIS